MTNGWDPLWEDIHSAREWGSYPEEAVIRFTARNYYKANPRSAVQFLDLGCGGGSTTWYLCREGFGVTAVDGSKSAIASVGRRLARDGFSARLDVGNVTQLPYPDRSFDCVVEIGCLTCLREGATATTIAEVRRVLKPGGRFLSFTPARGCWGDGIGREVEPGTFEGADDGPFAGMGTVRFLAEKDIAKLYSGFSSVSVDKLDRTVNGRTQTISQWTIACQL